MFTLDRICRLSVYKSSTYKQQIRPFEILSNVRRLKLFSNCFETVAAPALIASCGELTLKEGLVGTCTQRPCAYTDILQILRINGSGVTDGGQGCGPPPWQAKCKNWAPLLACISVFKFLLIFRFLFLAFFKDFSECLPVILGVSTDESS